MINKLPVRTKKAIFYGVVITLLAIAVIPRYQQLLDGVIASKNARFDWIAIAILGWLGANFATAAVYKHLANPRIGYFRTVLVQIAASFTNRLLPGGSGGLGLNTDYLIKNKHRAPNAAAIVMMAALTAFISHAVLITVVLFVNHGSITELYKNHNIPLWLIWSLTGLASVGILFLYRHRMLRTKIWRFLTMTVKNLFNYRHRPLAVILSIYYSTAVTVFYVFCFWSCCQAVGLSMSLLQAFIVYTVGVIVGAATLTPGGLGGVEAGLAGGVMAYGNATNLAFSAVIIYRLITYWLPILPGYISFWWLRRKKAV